MRTILVIGVPGTDDFPVPCVFSPDVEIVIWQCTFAQTREWDLHDECGDREFRISSDRHLSELLARDLGSSSYVLYYKMIVNFHAY